MGSEMCIRDSSISVFTNTCTYVRTQLHTNEAADDGEKRSKKEQHILQKFHFHSALDRDSSTRPVPLFVVAEFYIFRSTYFVVQRI